MNKYVSQFRKMINESLNEHAPSRRDEILNADNRARMRNILLKAKNGSKDAPRGISYKELQSSMNEDVYNDEFIERVDDLLYDLYELSSNDIDEKINNCQDPRACLILKTLKNIAQYIPADIIRSWF